MFSLHKSQRLTGALQIQELFQRGSSFHLHPLRVVFAVGPAGPHRVLVTVSKRHFKRAVDRNKLKRRLRESYRLNQHVLPPLPPRQIAFVYIGTEIAPYHTIERAVVQAIEKIVQSAK